MDESESLESLVNTINTLSERPYDVSIHAEFLKLANSLEGVDAEVESGLEMITQCMAAGDEVWIPFLEKKMPDVISTREEAEEVFGLFNKAEQDYLSIPVLEKHIKLLVEHHDRYDSGETIKPDALEDVFSSEWTRAAIERVVKKGAIHLAESHKLFELQWDFELAMLEKTPKSKRAPLIEASQKLLLDRLRQPQSDMDSTFQLYSSFTTQYMPPQDYETLMVSASKTKAHSVKAWERREQHELTLKSSGYSLEAYNNYIGYERRAKYFDVFCIQGIYERAIAEAAKKRFSGHPGSEEALQVFWAGYCDALRIADAELDIQLETVRRAVRSVPGAGEVWARYMRLLERLAHSETQLFEDLETVSGVFDNAINAGLVQKDIEQLVPVILARATYERRRLESNGDETVLPLLIGIMESGLDMSYQAQPTGDPKLRLEKLLAELYENLGLVDNSFEVWQKVAKQAKASYSIWLNYTQALAKHQRFDEVREIFTEIHTKSLDWPEAIWEAWISFENAHGTVEELEECLDKIDRAQYQTNARRAREAEKAMQIQMQMAPQGQPMTVETAVPVGQPNEQDVPMTVDESAAERGTKRGHEEDEGSSNKKTKFEPKAAPLKRDRENSTVFVASLSPQTSENDLRGLFKDCGPIREVRITELQGGHFATVEFMDRSSVPAALTKTLKRVHDQEITVELAWKSTLYVTNFPESADDAFIQNVFGNYGTILETRWPSKKFKSTRRFCYIQFTTSKAAQASLELHNRELEPNLPLCVYISDPERKKERTDHDANEREVYVAGLSKFTTKEDLEKLFSPYGPVKEVRLALDDKNHAKGFAFVEFENVLDAQKALMANNTELKKRRIAITMSDSRVKARHRNELGEAEETRNRSIYVKNLPPSTQEGLLQQAFEKLVPVKRVEVFLDRNEAIIELQSPADVGKLMLRKEPIEFGGNILELSDSVPVKSTPTAASKETPTLFKPRNVRPSKPKAGLGFKQGQSSARKGASSTPDAAGSAAKGQDDFRKMLEKKS